jgi:hypothetical protein
MPTTYAEGLFGTSLFNPARRVPGFMEGGEGKQITLPLPIATASKKLLHSTHALFALSCPPLEKRGGGVLVGGGRGRNWKCEMMMDDDEMNYFLHSLYNGILRARG